MNIPFIVTLVGADRPGLVNALAERAAANGANWLDSSMAHLAGKFAGIVRLDVAAADADRRPSANRPTTTQSLAAVWGSVRFRRNSRAMGFVPYNQGCGWAARACIALTAVCRRF